MEKRDMPIRKIEYPVRDLKQLENNLKKDKQ